MRKLNALIRNRRIKIGLKQMDVIAITKIKHRQHLANWEGNKCGIPIKYWKELARVLQLNLKVLIAADMEDFKASLRKALKL